MQIKLLDLLYCLFPTPDFNDWGCVWELLGCRAESDFCCEKKNPNQNISHLLAKYSATCGNKHLSQMNFDSSQHPQTTSAVAVLLRAISGIVIEKYFLFSFFFLPKTFTKIRVGPFFTHRKKRASSLCPIGSTGQSIHSSDKANLNLKPPKKVWIVSKNNSVTTKTHRRN